MVFILGNHRSGTTILYNALIRAGRFCYPTPFHLAHFRDYLRDARFDQGPAMAETETRFRLQGIVDRFVDDIPAHARSPEEYGFALPGGRLTGRTLDAFTTFCGFVRSGAETDRLLLLKNPRDFANFRFIHRSFPQAKFIFIHRHPGPTIDSRIRELQALFARRSPYQAEIEPRYDRIMRRPVLRGTIRACLGQSGALTVYFLGKFHRDTSRFLRRLGRLPRQARIEVTYEELCSGPERVVDRILAFLELGHCDKAVMREMIRPRGQPAQASPLLHSAPAARLLRPYLQHCGYRGLWPEP